MTGVAAMGKVASLPRKAIAALKFRKGKPTFFLEFTVVFALVALVLSLAAGFALSRYVASEASAAINENVLDSSKAMAQLMVNSLRPEQLDAPLTGDALDSFDRLVHQRLVSAGVVRVNVWRRDGVIVYSTDRDLIGKAFPLSEHRQSALAGESEAEVEAPREAEQAGLEAYAQVIEVYTPVRFVYTPVRFEGSSTPVGVFELYRDYAPVAGLLANVKQTIYVGISVTMASLYLVLVLIVRRGSNLIGRQNTDLELRADELKDSYESIVVVLCSALDLRDNVTHGHAMRVGEMASVVAWQMGMRKDEVRRMEKAAILHDIGKIGVADAILSKPGSLDEAEWAEMKRHPELGYRLLQGIDSLKDAAEVVYAHHERWDGSGYPRGLKGEHIPLEARIFAIVDAYDAMTSHRPYRRAMSHRYAVQEILRHAGSQFDPEVVRAFTDAERRGLFDGGHPKEHEEPWPADAPSATRG